jgi:hypothetical protein
MLRWLWRESGCVFAFAQLLAFSDPAVACGILHDAADGLFEHSDSSNGPGRAAGTGDGGLFDDVHGNGSYWSVVGGRAG